MNSKQIVLTGLVFTSLLISLTLTNLLPNFILALIILGIGITATYYIALYQKRLEDNERLGVLVRAAQDLQAGVSMQSVIEELIRWVTRAVPCEHVFVWLAKENDFYPKPYPEWSGWGKVNQQILDNKTTLVINTRDNETDIENIHIELKSFAAVPFIQADQVDGVLYLVNKKDEGVFNKPDQQMLETLCLNASLSLKKISSTEKTEETLLLIIKTLLQAMESLNPNYIGHTERVTRVSLLMGEKLGLDEEEIKVLKYSALLHDTGKMLVQKKQDLNEAAQDSKDHATLGAELLPATGLFQQVREGVLYHHERYNGSGYPHGLSQTDIPFAARIIAVADIYDAMTKLCTEEDRLDHKTAMSVVKKATGTLFDPLVVVAMEEVENEVEKMYGTWGQVYCPHGR